MNSSSDTIVALSTPRDRSGIGVIRVSGPDSVKLLERIFSPLGSSRDFPDRCAVYGTVCDPETGMVVDDAIALVMRGPRSYTGEDVVELSLHGSPVVLDMVQRILVSLGSRPATRGEFTRRAFLSGRLDLVQAEAVIDLIEAVSPGAAEEARARLDKSLSAAIYEISSELKDVLAQLEAHIDFDQDEEEPPPESVPALRAILRKMERLIATADNGRMRREGIRVTIVGKPNVGKSTLFNALLKTDRAIVTPHAGTTRDCLEERALLNGVPFVLSDTAGIREKPEPVEEEGIRRSRSKLDEADIVVAVVDGSTPIDRQDVSVLESCEEKSVLVVLNKSDLGLAVAPESEILGPPDRPRVTISARSGEGVGTIEEALAALGGHLTDDARSHGTGTLTQRGVLLLQAARAPLIRILDATERPGAGAPAPEIVSLEVRLSLGHLEEITGERWDEGILDRIFDRFCVGK